MNCSNCGGLLLTRFDEFGEHLWCMICAREHTLDGVCIQAAALQRALKEETDGIRRGSAGLPSSEILTVDAVLRVRKSMHESIRVMYRFYVIEDGMQRQRQVYMEEISLSRTLPNTKKWRTLVRTLFKECVSLYKPSVASLLTSGGPRDFHICWEQRNLIGLIEPDAGCRFAVNASISDGSGWDDPKMSCQLAS